MSWKKLELPDKRDIWVKIENVNLLGIRKIETLVDSETGLVNKDGKKNKELKAIYCAKKCGKGYKLI